MRWLAVLRFDDTGESAKIVQLKKRMPCSRGHGHAENLQVPPDRSNLEWLILALELLLGHSF